MWVIPINEFFLISWVAKRPNPSIKPKEVILIQLSEKKCNLRKPYCLPLIRLKLNDFLKKIHDLMKSSDYFLIGLDMKKNNDILFKAYNDTKDLTAKFNLNVLERINRELGADFITSQFAHKAYYNESKGRIEMYLRSLSDQTVTIPKADISIQLAEDELIHTENSHKFTMSQIDSMFEDVGLDIVQIWFDTKKYFGLILAKKF